MGEFFFNPEALTGNKWNGIHQCIWNSVKAADEDLRAALLKNIVIQGVISPRGICDRLKAELK